MLQAYVDHVAERAALGIPPLPLSAKQTAEVIELMKTATSKDSEFLLNLITYRVPAGVDDAAKVKASYLAAVAHGTEKTLLMFDQFHDVKEKADKGNANAIAVLQSWADAEWFTSRPEVPESITVSIFKVAGEINTDDLSPAPDATTRPDIPMHALAMHKNARPGIVPEEDGKRGPVKFIEDLRARGHLVAYAGDVVGTGS